MRVWIGLGSNLGDRHAWIRSAAQELEHLLENIRISRLIETIALDRDGCRSDEPGYINAVIVGETFLLPRDLFEALMQIERALGRPSEEKSLYLPRTIDLDILRLEDESGPLFVNDPDLVIPHPRLPDRPFLEALISELALEIENAEK